MAHLDDETLALAALGEQLDTSAASHLQTCSHCSRELAELTTVAGAARAAGPDGLERPAPRVWDAIARELQDSGELPATGSVPGPRAGSGPAPAGPAESPRTGAVAALDDRRRSRGRGVWIAAASFLLGVGAALGVPVLLDDDGDVPPVVARAELEPLAGRDVTGSAALHEADGRRTLVVELPDTQAAGFLEVWLLDEQAEQLVSLGILDGTEGRFAVPPDIDLEEFPVVDVSDEPVDGDPAHGGDSVVRGSLS